MPVLHSHISAAASFLPSLSNESVPAHVFTGGNTIVPTPPHQLLGEAEPIFYRGHISSGAGDKHSCLSRSLGYGVSLCSMVCISLLFLCRIVVLSKLKIVVRALCAKCKYNFKGQYIHVNRCAELSKG